MLVTGWSYWQMQELPAGYEQVLLNMMDDDQRAREHASRRL